MARRVERLLASLRDLPDDEAVATVQLEPVWAVPPTEDTAGELRARSLLALVHTRYPAALDLVAEALADPLARVRMAAATAIGDTCALGASAVLRLKIRLGDSEPEVIGNAVGSLLAIDGSAGLAVAEERRTSTSTASEGDRGSRRRAAPTRARVLRPSGVRPRRVRVATDPRGSMMTSRVRSPTATGVER